MSGKRCGKRKRSNSGPAGQATHSPSSPTLPLALATDTREPAAQDDAAAEEQRGQPDGLDNHIGELSAAENRVDEWKRKWTAANPTLELPDDIARMITDFAELAKPPSMARFNLALDALNAASNSESLDSIREAIAQVNMERVIYTQSLSVFEISLKKAFRLADDIKRAVSGSYILLDRPVACIHSPGKTTPSLHKVDNRQKFSGTPKLMAIDVQGYVSEIRRTHPGLMSSRVKLGDNNLARSNKERMISCEQDMMPYFQSEIAPRIAHILQHRRPEALVEVVEGKPTDHADLFLKVTSLNANGKTVTSSVAIEFKKPYGNEHLPVTPEIREKWPEWINSTSMPSTAFANLAVRQIIHYMVDGDSLAPPTVRNSIVSSIGFLTTFNTTWIVVAMPVSQPPEDSSGSLVELPPAFTYNPKEKGRLRLYISRQFHADDDNLPVAFVYAYVIEHVLNCTRKSTGGFKKALKDKPIKKKT